MGEQGAIEAGKAFIEYILDDSKLDSQLGQISHKLNAMSSNVALLASGAAITAFGASAIAFGEVGDELQILSEKTGISAEKLSEFKYAAQTTRTDLDTLGKAFKELQKNGIDPAQFEQIAADIREIPDATGRAEAAIEIFGKSGEAILPLIQRLPELTAHARELGLTMSNEDAAAASEFSTALGDAEKQVGSIAVAVGSALAGPLTDFLKWSQGIVTTIIEWIHNNPALVDGIVVATGVLFTMSAAMKGLAIAAALAEAFTNPVALALSLAAGAGAAGYISYATSGSAATIASPATASAGASPNGSGNLDAVIDRLDKLINVTRSTGVVAGVG